MKATDLPDNLLRRIHPDDRKALGKAAMTSEEAILSAKITSEKKMQDTIAALLKHKNIEFLRQRMDKPTSGRAGWPDFTFAINGVPIAVECKLPGETLAPDQCDCHAAMQRNGWVTYMVTSVFEVHMIVSHHLKQIFSSPLRLESANITP
jgi:hypothetical protein